MKWYSCKISNEKDLKLPLHSDVVRPPQAFAYEKVQPWKKWTLLKTCTEKRIYYSLKKMTYTSTWLLIIDECPKYLVKSAIRCNAIVCCIAGSSSNSEAVKEWSARSTKWSKAPILRQSDSAVDYKCMLSQQVTSNDLAIKKVT